MKTVAAALIAFAVTTFLAPPVWARDALQDSEKETLKKKILDEVRKKLDEEFARILKEIERIVDERIKESKKAPPAGPAGKEAEEKPSVPAEEAPRPKATGYLGIEIEQLNAEDLEELGINSGLRVAGVRKDSPAMKGGIEEGDILLQIDGADVGRVDRLREVLGKKGAGTTVTVRLLTGDKEREARVTLGEAPQRR